MSIGASRVYKGVKPGSFFMHWSFGSFYCSFFLFLVLLFIWGRGRERDQGKIYSHTLALCIGAEYGVDGG